MNNFPHAGHFTSLGSHFRSSIHFMCLSTIRPPHCTNAHQAHLLQVCCTSAPACASMLGTSSCKMACRSRDMGACPRRSPTSFFLTVRRVFFVRMIPCIVAVVLFWRTHANNIFSCFAAQVYRKLGISFPSLPCASRPVLSALHSCFSYGLLGRIRQSSRRASPFW